MDMKQNQIFLYGTYSNLTPYLFSIKKILNYFNDFQNQNFSFLLLQLNQMIEMKQNQTFFPWDTFKSDSIFHWSQNTKIFQWLL